MIRPLYLIPDKNVSIVENDKSFAGLAEVGYNRTKDSYIITFNQENISKFYNMSWMKNMPYRDEFCTGLLIHEIAHIWNGSLLIDFPYKNGLFHTIWNILLDSHDEYQFTRAFPSVGQYIKLALSILKTNTSFSKPDSKDVKKEIETIENRIEDLFALVRFGIILKTADRDFISFCLPFTCSSMRYSVKNVVEASCFIYLYIIDGLSSKAAELVNSSSINKKSIGDKDIAEIELGEEITHSSVKDLIENNDIIKESFGAARSNRQISIIEGDSAFYRKTVEENKNLIRDIRKAFRIRLEGYERIYAPDGDLEFSRQQQAYIDSLVYENGFNYSYLKRTKPDMDVSILRDISGSTSGIKIQYAELTISLIAALSNFDGIRLSQIDFSDSAVINLPFDSKINESRIIPISSGGTYPIAAYNEMMKLSWRGKNKIVIIITDGDFYGESDMKTFETQNRSFVYSKWHIGESYRKKNDMNYTTLEKFPEHIAKWLLNSF